MIDALTRLRSPALYQGGDTQRRYFEGWYFKAVDGEARRAVAVVPGVSFSEDGRVSQSFVQLTVRVVARASSRILPPPSVSHGARRSPSRSRSRAAPSPSRG